LPPLPHPDHRPLGPIVVDHVPVPLWPVGLCSQLQPLIRRPFAQERDCVLDDLPRWLERERAAVGRGEGQRAVGMELHTPAALVHEVVVRGTEVFSAIFVVPYDCRSRELRDAGAGDRRSPLPVNAYGLTVTAPVAVTAPVTVAATAPVTVAAP